MRHLGIDFGTKKVGLALSDESGTIAEPLTTIPNNERLVQRIGQYCQEYNVDTIVLGASVDFDGNDNPVMGSIRHIAPVLERHTQATVVFEDEFFTTAQAARTNGRKGAVDAAAAALILQSYLDRQY